MNVISMQQATIYAFNKALDQQSLTLNLLNGIPAQAHLPTSPVSIPETDNSFTPSDPSATGQKINVIV